MTEEELLARVEIRIRDWLASTSEFYAQPTGSDWWVKGLRNYIVYGPDSLTDEIGPRVNYEEPDTQ